MVVPPSKNDVCNMGYSISIHIALIVSVPDSSVNNSQGVVNITKYLLLHIY